MHEQVHLWQQNFGINPVKPGRVYHNKEFVKKCESLGLHPKLGAGYHTKQADGLFAEYLKELGIEPSELPEGVEFKFDWFKEFKGKERKGRSTLRKFSCECGQNIRVGKKDWPGAVCNNCGSQYKKEKLKS